MTQEEAEKLIVKYIDGTATDDERGVVEQQFMDYLKGAKGLPSHSQITDDNKEIWKSLSVHVGISQSGARQFSMWPRFAAAAVLLIVTGLCWFYFEGEQKIKGDKRAFTNSIHPGHNTAVLQLSNGATIDLSSTKTGVVINAGKLVYNDGSAIANASDVKKSSLSLNTVSTPRGGTYQVVLPDNSKVWLNAASTLKFPSTFAGLPNRVVELSGEGYFEVSKDKKHPFQVKSADQDIEVLGTHFDVESYPENNLTKTTLLEGSVAVHRVTGLSKRRTGERVILSPNQQSILVENDNIKVTDVESSDAVAWKNGYFMFNNENLGNIMVTLSRWYNTTIKYEDESLKSETVYAKLGRYENITKILKILERTDKVKFKIEGNIITISRK
ncbi:FecR family protein [Mucilaginibacter aquaedulcis]|uniref:FecR family protein n=1 Tax=Mucilaginibacter aquaedulcis TaxID=1187081 RepID=UPI0025B3C8F5|nr:FecR family protein [Mucilaginibacter aquaedulcis]MDN3548846.1 FecR family protein [Mucilaginibacter aquaedulcis]